MKPVYGALCFDMSQVPGGNWEQVVVSIRLTSADNEMVWNIGLSAKSCSTRLGWKAYEKSWLDWAGDTFAPWYSPAVKRWETNLP